MKKLLILASSVLMCLCMAGCAKKAPLENYNIVESFYIPNMSVIEYPMIENASDTERQQALNKIMEENIMAFAETYDIVENNGRLNLDYDVKLKNSENISILYKGEYTSDVAAYPTVVKTTVNLDLRKDKKIGLKDMKKVKDIVKLISAGNFTVVETDETLKQAQIDYIKGINSKELTNRLKNVDMGKDFSYMTENEIVLVLEVPHAIGDYAEYVISK